MRNICLFMKLTASMDKYCPDAWLLNFTNPMSMLTTYLLKYTKIKSAGFCHQVHGTFGVISEQLGFEPDELQVISAGVNHLNWLFDLRCKSTGKSYLKDFLTIIETSKWWNEYHKNVAHQTFSLEVYKTFGIYPIGYDDHICEYFSCFYEEPEWAEQGFESIVTKRLKPQLANKHSTLEHVMQQQHLIGGATKDYPFPKDENHPHYNENPIDVIIALESNNLLYLDANVGFNNGAITNLPNDAIIDRPSVIIGGEFRSIHVGKLPLGAAEICRRQINQHEMIVKATVDGDQQLAIQALCLDPYVRSITQAKNIWQAFKKEYIDYLPEFEV
jgi:alpha-galactosidase